jgi:hypothetical protein
MPINVLEVDTTCSSFLSQAMAFQTLSNPTEGIYHQQQTLTNEYGLTRITPSYLQLTQRLNKLASTLISPPFISRLHHTRPLGDSLSLYHTSSPTLLFSLS